MERDYLPAPDNAFVQWLQTFGAAAAALQDTLHFSNAELQALQANAEAFAAACRQVQDVQQMACTAMTTRNTARQTADADARALVRRIQSNPAVSEVMKVQLGVTVGQKRRAQVPVQTPDTVRATVQADLRVRVQWNRNGNTYG